jgi:hypothetical protein
VRLQNGQRWQCESRYCGSEIQVLASSQVECGINPRCSCGSMMKRLHVAPEVNRGQAAAAVPAVRRKAAHATK